MAPSSENTVFKVGIFSCALPLWHAQKTSWMGLGQCTPCRVSIGCYQLLWWFFLLWKIVTCSFLAVTISDVKSLFSNFQSFDTYNGLSRGFAIILFLYLWSSVLPIASGPFTDHCHKFPMAIASYLWNIHLYEMPWEWGRYCWLCLLLLIHSKSLAPPVKYIVSNGHLNTEWA